MIGRTLGHYEIVQPLGAGGMGEVYLARDTKLDREVALKVLPAEVAEDATRLGRLQREAKALAALDHPGIVTVFSVEEEQGIHFLTMACVKGKTLRELIPPEGMPLDRLLELGAALADALRAAHEQGIVHRDLKPSNVMVDSEGRLRVLDFGLSRVVRKMPLSSQLPTETMDEALTRRGMVLGTVPYMSPEQAEGKPVGPPSDLFSLGVVLYEMATGRRPFHGESAASLISSILRDTPPPVSELRADLPVALAALIERCLEKAPGRRYESAAEVRDELEALRREALVGGFPRETPAGDRRRLAGLLALGLAGLLAIGIAVGTFSWRAHEAGDQPSQLAPAQPVVQPIRSIAVLPLLDLSGDPGQEYFVDGMTEALIHGLARIRALQVISRTSVMRFKDTDLSLPEIARQLGVDAVVEGSVQREADTVRISAQLVDAATDRHLWGDVFERTLEGALQLQSEVARSIADAIAVEVSPGEASQLDRSRRVNPATLEAYLRGKHFLGKGTLEGLEKGMAFLQQAVDADPADPLGYAGSASGYVILGHATGEAEYIRRAKAAARQALELDDAQAEALAALAEVALYFDWDWDAADAAFRRALELNPSQAELHVHYGALQTLLGDLESTFAEHQLARELDPLSPSVAVWQAEFLWPFGRYDEAEGAALTALELNPGFPHAHAWLGQTYLGQGKLEEALEHARIAAKGNPRWLPWLGTALVTAGRRDEAGALLEELLATPKAGYTLPELAVFQAAFDDLDGAMATLERAFESRSAFMPWVGSWADLGELVDDPRFRDLLERMNLEFVRPRLMAEAAQG